jgi:hypothetical protein
MKHNCWKQDGCSNQEKKIQKNGNFFGTLKK